VSEAGATGTIQQLLDAERRQGRRVALLGAVVALAVLASAYFADLLDGGRLTEGIPAIGVLLGDMLPPDFSNAGDWVGPILDTLAMSLAGTALAILLSLPLCFLAAHNTAPHPLVYRTARLFLNFFRAIPELILGIVFVAAVGFGTLPGVLALGLHSVGMVGKFFAEAVEHVDGKPVEAAHAAGAAPFQVVQHAILPQVLPQFLDVAVYRWEYNFRASTVMGMVGAGGIGLELMSALRLMQYQNVAGILICILAMVTVVDSVGSALRRRLK